jgi:pyruvate formate lyase activating enzyme
MGCKGIAYTYSEPTVFIEYALETMKKAREVGLKNIWVSNGMTSDCAIDLLLPWIDAANIDIKASDETSYKRSVNGSFEAVINTIGRFHEACIHIEVTTLVVPGVNDTDDDFKTIAKAIFDILGEKAIWHVTRFFPAYRMNDSDPTPHGRLKLAKEIGHAAGIPIIHLGNI